MEKVLREPFWAQFLSVFQTAPIHLDPALWSQDVFELVLSLEF